VLNNAVVKDNRFPPYGMDYETARKRNVLPVPASQYGGGTASYGGTTNAYEYWDEMALNPPDRATGADITLYYQGMSWEYIQFLWLANKGTDPAAGGNAFLGEEGVNMLDAWINADPTAPMVPPFVMATARWGDACTPTGLPDDNYDGVDDDCSGAADDAYVPTETTCGTGVRAATGLLECVGGTYVGGAAFGQELSCMEQLGKRRRSWRS